MSTGDLDPEEIGTPAEPDARPGVADALAEVESAPLDERAAGYDRLAEQLRGELERSDPARGSA